MSNTSAFGNQASVPFGVDLPPSSAFPAPTNVFPAFESNAASLSPPPKPRANTFQDVKLVLRDQPTTVFCPSCKRNVVTNLKGKRTTL